MLDQAEALLRCAAAHGTRYGYEEFVYKTVDTKAKILCAKHGTFEQAPEHHWRGQGCPTCGVLKRGLKRRSNRQGFEEKGRKKHGELYSYKNSAYVTSSTPVLIGCNTCGGQFMQSPNSHLNGRGCPCRRSWAKRLGACTDCGIERGLATFTPKTNRCCKCTSKRVRTYRNNNLSVVREKDRVRAAARYAADPEAERKRIRRWVRNNLAHHRACCTRRAKVYAEKLTDNYIRTTLAIRKGDACDIQQIIEGWRCSLKLKRLTREYDREKNTERKLAIARRVVEEARAWYQTTQAA